jgi:hypothetical protein
VIDLGGGHVGMWFSHNGAIVGLIERHEHPEDFEVCAGGGYVAWVSVPDASPPIVARHVLVSGGPDDVEHLTISPSLWHRARDQSDTSLPLHANGSRCSPLPGCHGHVRSGRWVDAASS